MTYQLHEVQQQLATVLLALERSSEEVCPSVRASVNHLAFKANVFTFGTVGDVVAFEPFAHYVIDDADGKVPEFVTIVLSGVRAVRDDDSVKVLSRALVKTA
jgi:hypothetical protein